MTTFERTLGRYRLLRLLGEGGVGRVHLACSHGAAGFEKLVALKVLRPELTADPAQIRSLQDEAHIGADLEHRNIVQVLDLGEEADTFYVVMEYVRGFSLAQVLSFLRANDAQLPTQMAVHIFRAISRALEHVHTREGPGGTEPLFHGDVSASNVLLGASGRIALTDFGVAAVMHNRPEKLAGKWSYVPPEALLGGRISHSWDLFALGALLYEMLAGEKAFACDSFAARSEMGERCAPLKSLRPAVSQELSDLLQTFVAPSPAARPNDARTMRRALDDLVPPAHDDDDAHERYLRGLFAEGDFVRSHGQLPTSTSLRGAADPFMEPTEAVTAQHMRLHKPLRFGLSPAHGAELAKSHGEDLARVLRPAIERPVRPVLLGDYQTLLDCLLRGDVDIAWMPPRLMAQAAACGAGVLVVSQREGRPNYSSCLVTRRDSAIESLDDVHGKTVAWVDKDSSSGYLSPRRLIETSLGSPQEVLGRTSFHGSHQAVCEAVANGWTDLGATYVVCDDSGAIVGSAWDELLGDRASELRAVAITPPIPGDCIAHRPGFSERWFDDLRRVLRAMHETEDGRDLMKGVFRAERFVDGLIEDYESLETE